MLTYRLRRWPNIETTLVQRFVFTGRVGLHICDIVTWPLACDMNTNYFSFNTSQCHFIISVHFTTQRIHYKSAYQNNTK